MKFGTAIISLLHICSHSAVDGACNADEHHPLNGGYFIEGVAGFENSTKQHRTHRDLGNFVQSHEKSKPINATWAIGGDYHDGSVKYCTGSYCSDECETNGCPAVIEGHTCSMLRFCYEKDSGSDVWLLPNEMALAKCDFSEATQVCDENAGSDEDCCNYYFEEAFDLKTYFFSSKVGCEQGMKAAVHLNDFDAQSLSCYNSGGRSSRIQTCTCEYEDREMSHFSEPCHTEYMQGCLDHFPDLGDDRSCCETGTCLGHHKNFDHPIGKAKEEDRRLLCNDEIPGRCFKTVGEEMTDCCGHTCSSCGTDKDPWYEWASCDVGDAASSTGECGWTGRWSSREKVICDFSKCLKDDHWYTESDAYANWMEAVDPEGFEAHKSHDHDSHDSHDHGSHDSLDSMSAKAKESGVGTADNVVSALAFLMLFFTG